MENFPITLASVYFTKSIVIAIPNHQRIDGTGLQYAPINNISVEKLGEEERSFVVTFTTKLNIENDPSDPYHIDMECIGIFNIAKDANIEEATNGLVVVAHNVLYGAIRESVLWITGRQPHGPLNLGLSILNPTPNATKKE